MTVIYTRPTFLLSIVLLAIQTLNIGWASDGDEKPASIRTGASSSSALIVIEKPAAITRRTPASLLPTVEEYDDAPPMATSPHQHPRVEFDDHIDLSQQPPKMPFQLGFEFQETKGLCKWALQNSNFQRKPFFFVANKEMKKRLWTLVIDTTDIEFVTVPFTNEEEVHLARCMDSLLIAFNSLKETLTRNESTTFENWTDHITASLNASGFILGYFAKYELVRDKPITRPKEWVPTFSPQVTIQHPLEYTIPLSFMLFGFDCHEYMFPFCASLPSRNALIAAQMAPDSEEFNKIIQGYFQKKISGLMFLHALTLTQMSAQRQISDADLLQETLDNLEEYHQIDAKMRLPLMSRRPFSSMWRDLGLKIDYSNRFMSVMRNNTSFVEDLEHFPRLNYAEQHFDPTSGEIRSLKTLIMPLFEPEFLKINAPILEALLDQGIISTTMLRNFKPEIMTDDMRPVITLNQEYCIAAIQSVALPQKRYNISIETSSIQSQLTNDDALSPPWFLEMDNSMGAIKQDVQHQYGEAIVEFRSIKNVQPCFLRRANLDPNLSKKFLTNPNGDIKGQATALFRFLKQFGKPIDFTDFILGMTLAVAKH